MKAHSTLRDQIAEAIRNEIERLGNAAQISPTTLAAAVQKQFTGKRKVEPHIAYASLEHVKQIAREVLRNSFDELTDDGESDQRLGQNPTYQDDMFSGLLQERYPLLDRKAGEDPIYKLRRAMSYEEVALCVAHLRKSAMARMEHADALEAWNDARRVGTGVAA